MLKEAGGLTFQVSDEGDRLDGVARVGKSLDDVVLHYTDHTEAWLVTWNTDSKQQREAQLLEKNDTCVIMGLL